MRRVFRTGVVSAVLIALTISVASWQPARAATVEEVDNAIKKAIQVLYNDQKGDNWEGEVLNKQTTGMTALATYALLASGETSQNPKLAAAIEWLKKNPTQGIYALGVRCQVWNLVPHEKDQTVRDCIKRDGSLLLDAAKVGGSGGPGGYRGLYRYLVSSKDYDASASQYGVLGMWALEHAGLEVPDDYWRGVEASWKKNQNADKGWGYIKGAGTDKHNVSTVNLTAAGIASLFITQDYLFGMNGLKCTGNVDNAAIDSGMGWMEKNLPTQLAAGKVNLYGMYGIERIGVASGYKYFGKLDWYRVCSDILVKKQAGAGGWAGDRLTGGPIGGTAFGILFLTRGRAPVVMNKLQYNIDGKEANWNQRPRDAANVVKFIAKEMERDLNFQIVNLNVPVEELHDSPILYIAGNQQLKFTAAEEAKLKQFVEEGGLILGNADCSDPGFSKSFKTLGIKLFPDAGEFRDLNADNPMFTRQRLWKTWKNKPNIQGLSNKVRELMVLIPTGDPAKAWQQADSKAREEQFQLLSEIFLYAVEGKDLRYKGATYIVKANPNIKATKSIKVARLDLGENPDPEPGGWRRLSAVMHNSYGVDVETAFVKPDAGALKGYKVAHLTGTGKVKLNLAQADALKAFITGGGTLVIDAAGGDTEFGASIEDALHAMFDKEANQLSEAIPVDHAVYNSLSHPLGPISFRQFARGKVPRGQTTPLVRGMTINNRLAVIFSREDLSGGMVGESIDGIIGYAPDSATAIMSNVLAFATGGLKTAAAPAPGGTPATAEATPDLGSDPSEVEGKTDEKPPEKASEPAKPEKKKDAPKKAKK